MLLGSRAREFYVGFDVALGGRPNFPHTGGLVSTTTGSVPLEDGVYVAPTLDSVIASQVGNATRFRSIEMSATGNPNQFYSYEARGVPNAPEI